MMCLVKAGNFHKKCCAFYFVNVYKLCNNMTVMILLQCHTNFCRKMFSSTCFVLSPSSYSHRSYALYLHNVWQKLPIQGRKCKISLIYFFLLIISICELRLQVSQRTHKCPAQTSGNTQLSFDTIAQDADDKAIRPQINTFQEGQSTTNAVDNEENKFVLIINAQGQHVLALQSEINNVSPERKEENVEFKNANNTKKDSKSANNFNSARLEESAESIKKIQSANEKIDIKSTNNFFSMVMSPLENNILSPTFEMEHLRVSSPKHKEDSIDSYTNFSQVSDNVQMNIVESGIEESFNRDKDVTDTLQTINEESLKELLYGMDRK